MEALRNTFKQVIANRTEQNRTEVRDGLSRRALLRTAAASLFLPTVCDVFGQEETKKKAPPAYSELVDSDAAKTAAYTFMVQGLFTGNFELNEKLHPEYKLDFSDQQQSIFAQQKPCEFAEGYIYHGRGNLGKILLQGFLPPNSYLTRVPQTWALQPFVHLESEPAIFVIDALDFNRMQNQGKAQLRLRTDPIGSGKYDSEPYPSFTDKFPVNSVLKIITNEATYKKYKELVKKWQSQSSELTNQEEQLAKVLKPLFDENKILVLKSDDSKLKQLSEPERFLRLNRELETQMKLYELDNHMPPFRLQTKTSTKETDKSPKPLTSKQALDKLRNQVNTAIQYLKDKEAKDLATKNEKRRRERLESWRNAGLFAGGSLLLGGGSYYIIREVRKALELQEQESSHQKSNASRKEKGSKKKRT